MRQDTDLANAQRQLAGAKSVTVLTGAGISADSGIPTFRGHDGLWRNYRAEDLATPEAFARDPRLVWEWYNWRRELIAAAAPNPAHHALAALERRTDRFWLITQNVDGFHRAAGSRRLTELHGNIWMVRCTACETLAENRLVPIPILPRCNSCGTCVRPHIVWFGESLAQEDVARSYEALTQCELLVIIGTSGIVYPAASFGAIAKAAGAAIIEINLDATPATGLVDVSLQGRAKDIVPALLP